MAFTDAEIRAEHAERTRQDLLLYDRHREPGRLRVLLGILERGRFPAGSRENPLTRSEIRVLDALHRFVSPSLKLSQHKTRRLRLISPGRLSIRLVARLTGLSERTCERAARSLCERSFQFREGKVANLTKYRFERYAGARRTLDEYDPLWPIYCLKKRIDLDADKTVAATRPHRRAARKGHVVRVRMHQPSAAELWAFRCIETLAVKLGGNADALTRAFDEVARLRPVCTTCRFPMPASRTDRRFCSDRCRKRHERA